MLQKFYNISTISTLLKADHHAYSITLPIQKSKVLLAMLLVEVSH